MGVPYPLFLSASWDAGTAVEPRALLDEAMTAATKDRSMKNTRSNTYMRPWIPIIHLTMIYFGDDYLKIYLSHPRKPASPQKFQE